MKKRIGEILFCLIFVTIFGIAVLTYAPISNAVKRVSYFNSVQHAYANLKSLTTIEGNEIDHFIEQHPKILVIDLRLEDDYNQSHLEHAINIPIEQLETNIELINKQNTEGILLYSDADHRTNKVRKKLMEAGIKDIYMIKNGLRDYSGVLVK